MQKIIMNYANFYLIGTGSRHDTFCKTSTYLKVIDAEPIISYIQELQILIP